MGKRTSGFQGISRFVLEAFNSEAEPENSTPVASTSTMTSSATLAVTKAELPHPHWVPKYDATGLVPHYTEEDEIPKHLEKYFYQRERFFSLYHTPPGCLLDEEGWYSVTPELIADQIAERCRCDVILDAFCGVGGNAIAFAKTCQRVIALDTSPTRLALARHNAQIYGVAQNIEFILADYTSFAKTLGATRKIDVVFLSPPWGGPSYLSRPESPSKPGTPVEQIDTQYTAYSLQHIQPIPGDDLFHLTRKITQNVAYYLPRTTDLAEIGSLVQNEQVEVEEEWMGSKLKALTCYFGGLAQGQEHLY